MSKSKPVPAVSRPVRADPARRAWAIGCPNCRRHVMRGLDAAFGGRVVDADPEPLTALGEALALLAGRRTVELRWIGDRYEIDSRDHFRIRGSPAGTPGMDVLVIHDCDLALGQPLPHAATNLRIATRPIPLPLNPPF